MLKKKIQHLQCFLNELDDLKKQKLITWNTRLYKDWISISLTSDLSEAIANHNYIFWWKFLSQVTIDELIYVLSIDIKEKEEKLKNDWK